MSTLEPHISQTAGGALIVTWRENDATWWFRLLSTGQPWGDLFKRNDPPAEQRLWQVSSQLPTHRERVARVMRKVREGDMIAKYQAAQVAADRAAADAELARRARVVREALDAWGQDVGAVLARRWADHYDDASLAKLYAMITKGD